MNTLHQLKRPTFSITVYEKAVEIVDRRGCIGPLMPKKSTIPMRSISTVDVVGMTETLVIKTIDGKQYKFNVGGMGGQAKKVQEAILSAL